MTEKTVVPAFQHVNYIKFSTKRAFGIELEVSKNVTINKLVDAVRMADPKRECHSSNSYCQDQGNNYWHVKFDRSCGTKANEGGWEVASYKASGAKDLVKISEMGDVLKKAGAQINDNCGYHIHVEIADFQANQAATLVANWMKIEHIILEILPKSRRNNPYCKTLRELKPVTSAQSVDAAQFWPRVRPMSFDNSERRSSLNMCNYALGGAAKRTAELRLPEGTLDPKEIKNWARFFIHFVNFSKKQAFPGNVAPAANLREAMRILGLHGEDPYFILSHGLYETKHWFLSRILQYSGKKVYKTEAQEFLNFIIPANADDDASSGGTMWPIGMSPKKTATKKKKATPLLDDDEFWQPYEEETTF